MEERERLAARRWETRDSRGVKASFGGGEERLSIDEDISKREGSGGLNGWIKAYDTKILRMTVNFFSFGISTLYTYVVDSIGGNFGYQIMIYRLKYLNNVLN